MDSAKDRKETWGIQGKKATTKTRKTEEMSSQDAFTQIEITETINLFMNINST